MEDIKICILGFFTENTPDPATIGRKCEALGFDALYVGDHPIMPAQSQGLVGTGVADRMPDRIDAAGERRLGNDSPFPDGVEQIILADHAITVVDQVDEQIEDLRPDIDQLGAAPQLAAIHVYRIFTELKWHSGFRLRRGGGDPRAVGK